MGTGFRCDWSKAKAGIGQARALIKRVLEYIVPRNAERRIKGRRKMPTLRYLSACTKERPSRCEQHGWTEVKAKSEGPRSGSVLSLNRREAVRREQAGRDHGKF